MSKLLSLGANFNGSSFDWSHVRDLGLLNHCINMQTRVTCGKVVAHCKNQVKCLIEKFYPCCFKIGVSGNPLNRFAAYIQKNYSTMWLICVSHSSDSVHMLEAAIISEFYSKSGCQNKPESGGEGALGRTNPPPPPYFVYIVVGRADQGRRVG